MLSFALFFKTDLNLRQGLTCLSQKDLQADQNKFSAFFKPFPVPVSNDNAFSWGERNSSPYEIECDSHPVRWLQKQCADPVLNQPWQVIDK
jgi:hypothetical protein